MQDSLLRTFVYCLSLLSINHSYDHAAPEQQIQSLFHVVTKKRFGAGLHLLWGRVQIKGASLGFGTVGVGPYAHSVIGLSKFGLGLLIFVLIPHCLG